MTERQWRQQAQAFTERLVQLKDEAGRLGLWRTMHALEAATRAVGYEHADIRTGQQVQPWTTTKKGHRS